MNNLETWQFADRQPIDDVVVEQFGKVQDDFAINHGDYLKGVLNALENKTAGLVDGMEGRKSLELISALYESIETGREVALRFKPKKCKLGEL